MPQTIVVALGGNAITKSKEKGTWDEQWHHIQGICPYLVELAKAGHHLLITHGNGPQVGNLMLKNECAKAIVPPMPLDVCVANTQGSLGYGLCQNLKNALLEANSKASMIAIITQVVVSPKDQAFVSPSKFIGPFFSEREAQQLMTEKQQVFREDSGRGWRRVVPSPQPLEIIESKVINKLLAEGVIVVAAGGGGIPVIPTAKGLVGVEAVIDKDKASQLLATAVGADLLLLLTDVDHVCINFGKPNQQELAYLTVVEARKYLQQGQFPSGSMGPKVEAAIEFASSAAGRKAIIVSLENASNALNGNSGTLIAN